MLRQGFAGLPSVVKNGATELLRRNGTNVPPTSIYKKNNMVNNFSNIAANNVLNMVPGQAFGTPILTENILKRKSMENSDQPPEKMYKTNGAVARASPPSRSPPNRSPPNRSPPTRLTPTPSPPKVSLAHLTKVKEFCNFFKI